MNLIERNCPLCGAESANLLFKIPTSMFVPSNKSIVVSKLQQLGLYKKDSGMELVECDCCHMVYVPRVLHPELSKAYYNECIDANVSLSKTNRKFKQNRYEKLSKLLLQGKSDVVFEYGCGWGDFLTKAQRNGIRVIGLELDERKRDFCKSRGIQIVNSLSEIEVPIDVFFCNQVLEHLRDPKSALLEIKQYLRLGFIGYISVPLYSIKQLHAMKDRIAAISDKNINPYEHLNLFSTQTFQKFLISMGFCINNEVEGGMVIRNGIKL